MFNKEIKIKVWQVFFLAFFTTIFVASAEFVPISKIASARFFGEYGDGKFSGTIVPEVEIEFNGSDRYYPTYMINREGDIPVFLWDTFYTYNKKFWGDNLGGNVDAGNRMLNMSNGDSLWLLYRLSYGRLEFRWMKWGVSPDISQEKWIGFGDPGEGEFAGFKMLNGKFYAISELENHMEVTEIHWLTAYEQPARYLIIWMPNQVKFVIIDHSSARRVVAVHKKWIPNIRLEIAMRNMAGGGIMQIPLVKYDKINTVLTQDYYFDENVSVYEIPVEVLPSFCNGTTLINWTNLSFNGINEFKQSDNMELYTNKPFSYLGWVKIGNNSVVSSFSQAPLIFGYTNITDILHGLFLNGTNLYIWWYGDGKNPNYLIDNEWHHLAYVWDGVNIKLYVDAALVYSISRSPIASQWYMPFSVGANQYASPNTYINMSADEVLNMDCGANAQEIMNIYKNSKHFSS